MIKLSLFRSSGKVKWNSEFENLAVDLTYKWKDTATCLNLILDQFHDNILDQSFYTAVSGVPVFKVCTIQKETLRNNIIQLNNYYKINNTYTYFI